MIRFNNIEVIFSSKEFLVEAVKDISFNIARGEIFGIVGSSGAGKSSLLRTINLLQRPTSGSVEVDNFNITHYEGHKLSSTDIY